MIDDFDIKKKVVSGVLVLATRKFVYQTILSFSNIILARILMPEVFGSFAIISFIILACGLLVNFGLGPALVQKKGVVKPKHLRAIFTTLFISSTILIIIIYFLAPFMDLLYKGQLGEKGIFWLRIFSFSLLLNHLTAISTFLLQRNLNYKKLAIGEISVLFLAQVLTIFFAQRNLGIGSFVLGNLISQAVGFVLFFYLSPWKIGLNFRLSDLKIYLPFGLNYQANSLVNLVNTAIVPGFVGIISGSRAVGLINWAGGVRQAGLAPFEIIDKIMFPAASRIQNQKLLLKVLVEKMLKFSSMFSFPLLATIFALAKPLTVIIYTSSWLLGLTALYLSLIQGIFILLGGVFIDVLLALGRAKDVRNISMFWTALQWILTIPLVFFWNFNGVVLAGLLVSTTFFIPLRKVTKEIDIRIWPNVLPYLFYSILLGLAISIVGRLFLLDSVWKLFASILFAGFAYLIILLIFERKSIFKDAIKVYKLILK
ncbi:hypothetical protein A3D00_01945 [Candidatus Woesebacteria bacterium RIFCSPHIGHO2_02_FULL_38_9]|uniref:Uncharacterized protein n=1 Tax=Candidatus Woesebacteria bacterium RIFCSPHIGHO2_01_FULL_39_28 TaxID=1802496 RepID=A0A1F7YI67_9BACT|nr:MAG: hypothetical protein A2627_02505 [Candidatus Woesebacteria bacterium RIFCSPHIGHO2_01_FULL_39_28]OGM32212.1 MAG: hypothetical protein A3D00_01945 [Candidatus Woesebacteria bacterium RIFCSPHIGHO2_02_FULL_38_9]OGM57199.1 MAG: hypothetical protein A3A50_03365 [Candidatus Woesebacteria bacterium RIFCSPLOWO2_01_FULL_38_20]